MLSNDRILSFSECTHRAGVSLATWRRILERGEGPKIVKVTPRRRGVRESAFVKWLDERTEAGSPEAA
jgi:predicted DNA-binding transcriptional regulator AlpA